MNLKTEEKLFTAPRDYRLEYLILISFKNVFAFLKKEKSFDRQRNNKVIPYPYIVFPLKLRNPKNSIII